MADNTSVRPFGMKDKIGYMFGDLDLRQLPRRFW